MYLTFLETKTVLFYWQKKKDWNIIMCHAVVCIGTSYTLLECHPSSFEFSGNNTTFYLFIIIVKFLFIPILISVRYEILFVLMMSKDVEKRRFLCLSSISCTNPQTYLLNLLVPQFHFLCFLSENKKLKKKWVNQSGIAKQFYNAQGNV